MTRVPAAEITRLKRDVSIVELVKTYGVELRGSGDNLTAHCPLPGHEDRSPSLVVTPSKNLFHCLGKCGVGGDVIEWVKRMDRVSFPEAVERLQKIAPSLTPRAPVEPVIKAPPELAPEEPDAVVARRFAVEIFPSNLLQSAEAQAYLASRGLSDAKLVEHFKLGYSGLTLTHHLASKQTKQGAAQRAQLARLGLQRSSGYPHFMSMLTVPVLSEDGEVLEIYGRKLKDQQREGTPLHLYLPAHGRRGVFNLAGLRGAREVLWTEALLDALTFVTNGFPATSCSYGTSGFTREMRDALIEHEVKRVLVAYDADEAGDRGATELARDLGFEGIEVFRLNFPKGMDANAYALKMKPAQKALELVIGAAKWIGGPRSVVVPESLAAAASESAAPMAPVVAPVELATPAAPEEQLEANEPAATRAAEEIDPVLLQDTAVPTPPAESTPPLAALEPDEVIQGDEIKIRLGDRRWRVRGLSKIKALDTLRVNVQVAQGEAFYLDTLDLLVTRQRESFVREAARELKQEEKLIKSDVAKIIVRLDALAQKQLEALVNPAAARPPMPETQREMALALLRDPTLKDRIVADFKQAGVVGEEKNVLIAYFATVSRKLKKPLGIMIQSSSAAGKSAVLDAALSFVPEEDREQYAALTSQSIYYMGEMNLSHKVLAVSEEQGLASAAYALKLLQSEGVVSIASTGKDPETGRLSTIPYRVRGPVAVFLTTTSMSVDDELSNRLIVLTVDEGSAQTSAIHARQREAQTLEGLLKSESRAALVELHQNAQRLLEPLHVVNPSAKRLRFSSATARARRDHMKYLTLIQAIALTYQHQRPIKEVEHLGKTLRYIEATEADVALADELSKDVLDDGMDELPPQTRRLLELITEMVAARAKAEGIEQGLVRFSRRDVRAYTRWTDSALKKHFGRLEELEHLWVQSGGARRRMMYSLAIVGDLVTPNENWSPLGHPLVTPPSEPDLSARSLRNPELVTPRGKAHEGRPPKEAQQTHEVPTIAVNGHAGKGARSASSAKKAAS